MTRRCSCSGRTALVAMCCRASFTVRGCRCRLDWSALGSASCWGSCLADSPATTLAIPATILGETALSFLGLGLRQPAISWGVLLQDAQNIQAVALAPWLMLPALPLIVTIMAFNFLGDGLRDAADPYGR